MSRIAEIKADAAAMPIRDMGSFVAHSYPSEADLQDHRKQGGADAVFIGLQLPRRRHHRRRHHKHHRKDSLAKEDITDATPPSQRIQYILEDEDDEQHRAHDLFCEMTELMVSGNNDEVEWKETARWIKFEEDVEEGGERWSKPHVATLSLHSLFELRCSIMTGTVILDMDAYNLDQVTDIVLDNMIASKQLEENLRDQVHGAIMCRHKHQNEKRHRRDDSKMHLPLIRSLADIGKKYSEPKHLSLHGGEENIAAKSSPNMLQVDSTEGNVTPTSTSDLTENSSHKNQVGNTTAPTTDKSHLNLHFMKKIRPGSEASNIMVGEVDFLNHQIVAFVRLTQAVLLGDLTEVPVPTRFLFILLGPVGNQNKFHELGRSIGTLMSDEIFHDVAYHARNREDLLAGIDEFLDQVTVLPPGEWDPSIRIEPPKNVPSQESRKTKSSKPPLPNGKVVIEEEVDEHTDPTLQRTGRFFGGLRDDVRRKLPFWLSDFKDALHVQCIASFVFLYFACLTPIITFGGLLGDATANNMAAMESILAGAICGVTYSLFAGQPMTILGSTGPVLVFEKILHTFCHDNGLEYLSLRLWIGVWTAVALLLIVAFDLSALVRYITRFTEESFAALISLIFIYEAFLKLIKILKVAPMNMHPDAVLSYECFCGPANSTSVNGSMTVVSTMVASTVQPLTAYSNVTNVVNISSLTKANCTQFGGELFGDGCDTVKYVPDVFLLSAFLFLGTFTLAMVLKSARSASFFPTLVRTMVSDFAVIIAILLMIGTDLLIGLKTPKLEVPATFSPTIPDRGWIVNPVAGNPWWVIIAAIVPALLLTILIFMDQQITAVIINRKENKLVKGHGYHLDLFLVACLIIINSFLGLPWFVAATVLSINHVNSLKKESQCSAPGERPKFLGVREQRVTGICIFLFIGVSVVLTSVLQYIPMPVLYGVFLYMGVSSLNGMQLVDRILIVLMPRKYQPDLMYLRHVRTKKVHLFTFIQVFCLVVLWVVKTIKKISIAFPIMVLAMCFVRKFMDRLFTQRELKWLDDIMPESHKRAKEDEEKKKEEEDDFDDHDGLGLVSLQGGVVAVPIQCDSMPDMVNISEEMAKTGMWKTIMANDSSSNLINEEQRASTQRRKKKSKKSKNDNNGRAMPTIPASPNEGPSDDEDQEEHPRSPSKKKGGQPVTFFIDEEEDEKESLIKAPEIIVDPPSDVSRLNTPSDDESKV